MRACVLACAGACVLVCVRACPSRSPSAECITVQASVSGVRASSTYIVMAYIVMAYIVMAYIVRAYIVMAYIVMVYIVMEHKVMEHIVVVYIGMASIMICVCTRACVSAPRPPATCHRRWHPPSQTPAYACSWTCA